MNRLPLRCRIEVRVYPNCLDTSHPIRVYDAIVVDPNDCERELFRCSCDTLAEARAEAEAFIESHSARQ